MDQDVLKKIEEQAQKIEAIYTSVEKTRKYFLITMWVTVVTFVLPLLALFFIVPMVMSSYMTTFDGLL